MTLDKDQLRIDEIFLPAQTVSAVTTDITGLQGIAQELISAGRIDDIRQEHAELMAAKAKAASEQAAGTLEAQAFALVAAQMPDLGAAVEWAIEAGT